MKRVILVLCLLAMGGILQAQKEDSIYVYTSESARFPGGDSARIAFINAHLRKDALYASNIFKKVYVKLVVEKNGELSDVKILKGINKACDEELLSIVKSMPLWIPAKNDQEVVRSSIVFLVKFPFSDKPEVGNIYYNSNWEPTSFKKREFSRKIEKMDTLYQIEYFDDNFLRIESGEYLSINPPVKNGRFLCYYPNGVLKSEHNYLNGLLHGQVRNCFENGRVNESFNYKMDVLDGSSYEYLDDGQLVVEKKYVDGKLVKLLNPYKIIADTNNFFTRIVADTNLVLPRFPDGKSAMSAFIDKNLKFPDGARNKGISGESVIAFDIEIDGSITNIRVVKSLHPLLDQEAIRVVKLMPKWVPATKRGKPIKVKYTWYAGFKE